MITGSKLILPQLRYFKTSSEAKDPKSATSGSACFDLCACLEPHTSIKIFNSKPIACLSHKNEVDLGDKGSLTLFRKEIALIPTGLIFDIPEGHVLKIYIRSGTPLKKGLVLANSVGVIDSDYVEPVYLMIQNVSWDTVVIDHGDRLAQGELTEVLSYDILETRVKPEQKTERNGGFGSTGSK